MGMTQILAKVSNYSHLFHEASFGSFNKRCSDRKLSFLNSKVERKGTINKKVSVLSLYALKEESIVIYPIPSKRPPPPNNAFTPLPKIAKPKHDNPQPSLTTIARQFSSPAELTGFKLIHVPVRHRLPLQQLRSNLRRLQMNTRRILDIHYSNRDLVSFLIHIVCDDFEPLDPSIIRDPTLVSEPIDCKVHARKAFLHGICVALRRFMTPIYNAVANFLVQSGLIDLDDLVSYNLASPCKYCTGHILDHV
ncbi:hypothetical protein G6F37_002700 [Rhizopus arrhizus]|nr:hypothetical protein G6F38_006711 [Rhizopus arrhizus]KAG1161841.1 hypothetical protein G6F37_002700 [Rhizopus arrhizus]